MEILSNKKNSLLHREEIKFIIESDITPSKDQVSKIISEEFKKPSETIVIEKIESNFGTKKAKISAKVYNDLNSKNKYEIISRKQRKKEAEEIKKAKEAEKTSAEEGA